jgi:predicted dehydrogenase
MSAHRPSSASRREFLAAAAGTAAALLVSSSKSASASASSALPAAQPGDIPAAAKRAPLSENQTINLGIIGVGGHGQGGMGRGHCQAFATFAKDNKANVRIAALADINSINLEQAADTLTAAGQTAAPDTYRDYKKLLARDDIHAVLIASPEHWHAQMAIDAIAAGKDVYLEKPMTLRLDEALRLRQTMLANPDMRLQVGTQMTNLPKYHRAKDVIKSGQIGTPTFSQTSYCRNSKDGEWNYYVLDANQEKSPGKHWTPGDTLDWDAWCGPLGPMPWDPKLYSRWRRYRKTSTGIMGDLLVHVITPMLVAIGEDVGWPTRVVATGSHLVDKDMENHDNVHIAVQFESGHQMLIAGSTINEVGLEPLIRGHKGNIYLGGRHCDVRPERLFAEDFEPKSIECPDIGNDQDLHRLNFLDIVRTRKQPDSDVTQGAKVMTIVDLATRSIWEKSAFEFDPKAMMTRKV